MIYLRHTNEAQLLYVPKNGTDATENLRIFIEDTVDHNVVTFEVVDIAVTERYFRFAVVVPDDVACGEYQYQLKSGDVCLSCGLLIVTDDEGQAKQYNKTIKYKQYESE